MDTNTSRRAMIGSVGLAAIAAAAPAFGTVSPSGSTDAQWTALISTFNRADARLRTLGRQHSAAENAYHAGRRLLGERPQEPCLSYPRPLEEMTLRELRDCRVLPEAQVQHDAELASWDARHADLKHRTMGDVESRWEAAVSEQGAAAQAIFKHPAPDATGLLYKLELAKLQYEASDLDGKVADWIFADVQRLVGGRA